MYGKIIHMKGDGNLLAKIVCSQVRSELFRLLFDSHMPELHMREIERQSRLAIGTIQQDLKKLSTMNLITSSRDGNRLYYKANHNHPLFIDIKNLVMKTTGAVPLLAQILSNKQVEKGEILSAFIFGSIVIGSIGLRKLSHLLFGLSDRLGREINPHIITVTDFKKKLSRKDHFLSQVLETKKLFIIGSEHELEELGR